MQVLELPLSRHYSYRYICKERDLDLQLFSLTIGLHAKERIQVQEDWMDGKYPVISATVSFGMGVDKGSVR
jgi:superfamily II DNA helicase RecQ